MNFLSRIWVCSLAVAALWIAAPTVAQQKVPPAPRGNDDEIRQSTDIVRVTSATQKVQLLTAFLDVHPASAARSRLLMNVGTFITREPDAALRVTLAEKFLGLMSTEQERNNASAILADAYLSTNRVDDAFRTVALLPRPDSLDLHLLVRLATAGADETRLRNLKHLSESRRYGGLAIRAIEAGLRPGGMNAATWAAYKGKTLPSFYQSLGLLALHADQSADAVTHLQKAIELAPNAPTNYSILGAAAGAEFSTASQQLTQMPAGSVRDALEQRTTELLTQMVDAYAHALALSVGSPQEQAIRAQAGPELEKHYKVLHQGSREGLQGLIDKYKKK